MRQTVQCRNSIVCRVLRAAPDKTVADWQPEAVRGDYYACLLVVCVIWCMCVCLTLTVR